MIVISLDDHINEDCKMNDVMKSLTILDVKVYLDEFMLKPENVCGINSAIKCNGRIQLLSSIY